MSAPFTLKSFRAEAEEILAQARAEAARIREEAQAEGLAAGRDEGLRLQAAEGVRVAGAVAAQVESVRAVLEREAERDLVRLAVALAGRIVRAEVALGRPVAAAALKEALRISARRHELKVHVHPADLPGLAAPAGVSLVADPTVTRGGCIARSGEGAVDLSIETQLREIERGLIGA